MTDAPPSGIVSFLFTDVEGSTKLWEQDSSAMSASLAVHDEVLRRVIAEHDGHVFSTAGDAFAAAFNTTSDALDAALEAQLRLAAADWPGPPIRVRMGIHTGEAEERGGDYFGPVLNRAARIMSAGHGGQVLLSSTTAEMSSSWLSDETSLEDLGVHKLKDLDHPEHVYAVLHDDLARIDVPIRTEQQHKHNLTDYLTSFVGRDTEIEELKTLVRDNRLVSLTGVGGTGKTRMAVEAAHSLVDDLDSGCWLVELAPVTDPNLISLEIGEVLGLRPGPGVPIEDVLSRYLADKDLLLIIDNCEHVLDGATEAVTTLLAAGSGVKVLATSRESLGIAGEHIVRVPSLGLPSDPEHLRDAAAVQLFLDRARAVKPGFDPTMDELAAIARICTRIDGIPLGLELAAARLRSMSSGELADRLEDSFRVLSGSAKTALPRQRTLNATIDWSHNLLSEEERAVFRRAAMFIGGFDLAAAESACSGGVVADFGVLDHLDSLIDKSLLVTSYHPDLGTRYRMLEPVRQFAQEQLSGSGEAVDVRMAHAAHFVTAVGNAAPHIRGPEQMAWERRLDADYDNIRAAFAALLEAGRVDDYLDMAFDLFCYWQHVGLHFQGIPTTEAGLTAAPDDTHPQRLIKAYFTMAALGFETTLPRSVEDSESGLAIAEATGDLNLIGRMELALGASIRHATLRDDFGPHVLKGRELLAANPEPYWWEPEWEDAFHHFLFSGYLPSDADGIREHSEAAIEAFEKLGDEAQLVAALCESAMQTTGDEGRDAWIVDNLNRATEILERVHVPYWHGHAYEFLGLVEYMNDNVETARVHFEEAVPHLEDSGDLFCWSIALRGAGLCASRLGEREAAERALSAVLDRVQLLPKPERAKPAALAAAAQVLVDGGRHQEAAEVIGAAKALGLDISIAPYVPQFDALERLLVERLGEEAAHRIFDTVQDRDIDEALTHAHRQLSD